MRVMAYGLIAALFVGGGWFTVELHRWRWRIECARRHERRARHSHRGEVAMSRTTGPRWLRTTLGVVAALGSIAYGLHRLLSIF